MATQLDDTQILFDNVAAPLVYVLSNKLSAIVPYEIAIQNTSIQVLHAGRSSAATLVKVAPTSPGIFTSNASGSGPAAALNSDYTLNGSAHPAAKGSIVSLYGTGEGLIAPSATTGSITATTLPFPTIVASHSVMVNGKTLPPSETPYFGPAPTLVAGAIQINFRVPEDSPSGLINVQIEIGGQLSNVVTIAVK